MKAVEANFDGLVGPTHNYGGLSVGNLASAKNQGLVSNPKQAALQGLRKMKWLADAGLVQGVLPPHERPFLPLLTATGYSGSIEKIWKDCWQQTPELAKASLSAASMWAANAATVSPSADTLDGRLHFTAANLSTMLHRSIEGPQTARALRQAFKSKDHFCVHDPLPMHHGFADEGAANHVRLCADHGARGVELFVYGRSEEDQRTPHTYPSRQTLASVKALARAHGLEPKHTVMALQSEKAIDAGAFHNDVVCVGTKSCLFFHEHAFADTTGLKQAVSAAAQGLFEPGFVEVSEKEVPLVDAISSYLFNSMLVSWPGEDRLVLIAPKECQKTPTVLRYCETLTAGNGPIGRVEFVDVKQSMRNGGGPACLRLRVVLGPEELKRVNPKMLMNDNLYQVLGRWIAHHYRDALAPEDLSDPALITEGYAALDELTSIMDLGRDFYPFQRS